MTNLRKTTPILRGHPIDSSATLRDGGEVTEEEKMTTQVQSEISRGRRIGFYTFVVAGVLLVLGALFEALPITVASWFSAEALQEMFPEEAGIDSHRIHLFGLVIFTWLLLLPIVVQLFRPIRRFAAALYAVAVVVVVTVVDLLSGLFDPIELAALALVVGILWLHPGRTGASATPWHQRSLIVAAVGALGWLTFAAMELVEQLTGVAANPHVEFGHFGTMAAVATLIVIGAVIGSSALVGSRFVGVISAVAAGYLGLASLVFTEYESSLGTIGGAAAIVWAVIYLWSIFNDVPTQVEASAVSR